MNLGRESQKCSCLQVCGHFYLRAFLQSVFTGITHTENMYAGPTWCQTNDQTVCVFTVQQQQVGSSPLSLCKPASCASFKGVQVAWWTGLSWSWRVTAPSWTRFASTLTPTWSAPPAWRKSSRWVTRRRACGCSFKTSAGFFLSHQEVNVFIYAAG